MEYFMKINMAHLRERGRNGRWIDFAVFEAKSTTGTDHDNSEVLSDLTAKARNSGLKIDQSALAYAKNGRIMYFGSKHLVDYLSTNWTPQWTHKIDA